MTTVTRRVSFDECITIRHYEFDRETDMAEKSGNNWQETQELAHFTAQTRRIERTLLAHDRHAMEQDISLHQTT